MSLLIDLTKSVRGKDTSKVSDSERLKRVKKCNDCTHLVLGTNCGLCGCFVSDKAKYADEACPDGRW